MRQWRSGWVAGVGLGLVLAWSVAGWAAGGIMRVPIPTDPGMNPVIFSEEASVKINKVLFSTLTRPDANLRIVPSLAKRWEHSPDGLRWTFILHENVKFHDGKPLTAEDVKFTFEKILEPNPRSRWRANFASVDRVEAVDRHTVRFHMKRPDAALPAFVAFNAGIIPQHLLDGKDINQTSDFSNKDPVGSGPFKVKEVVPGDHITLVANPDFFLGKPKLDAIVFKIVGDINTAVAQAKAGELDFVPIEPVNVASVRGDARLTLMEGNVAVTNHISLNNKGVFADPRVRLAMTYGLDRQAIIASVMQGRATFPLSVIPSAFSWAYASHLPKQAYDPDKAKSLMGEAGWRPGADGMLQKDGKTFRFTLLADKTNPARVQSATVAQQMYKKLGMDAGLEVVEWSVYVQRMGQRAFDAQVGFWNFPPDPDPSAFYAIGAGYNSPQYENKEADQLLKAARSEMDPKKRGQLYHKLQEVMLADPPNVVLYYPKELAIVNARVKGLVPIGMRDMLLWSEQIAFE